LSVTRPSEAAALGAPGASGALGAPCSPFQVNVAIDSRGSVYCNDCPPQRTVNVRALSFAFTAISALEPSGLRKATVCRPACGCVEDAMRCAPARTNLLACPIE
jgi:hypothetical protein